jgi:hypothetical protein
MVGINELPDFVYIDEARIKQKLQFVNEGQVAELVETQTDTESKTSGGGFSIYKILKYNREKSSGGTEEVARTIQSTPVGQLAIFFGMMDEDTGVEELNFLTDEKRGQLEDGDYVSVTGYIRESPIAKLMRIVDKYNLDITNWVDFSDEDIGPEALKSELDDARGYYEMEIDGEVEGRYVFRLSQEDLTDIADKFPGDHKEYTVFGRIEHIFEDDEKEHHLSIFDEINTRDRTERLDRRRKLKEMANHVSQFYEGSTDESIFYIKSPDIRITPIAIFS